MSGNKVNDNKTSILLINVKERKYPISEVIKFKVVEQFEFFEDQILSKLEYAVSANYEPLMKKKMSESIDR